MSDDEEIQAADPATRMHAMIVLVLAIGAAILARHYVGLFLDDVDAQAVENPELALRRLKALLVILAMLMSCGLLVLATVVVWIGRRSAISDRFPPPGLPVLVDTHVRRGAAARRVARIGYAGGIFLALSALGVYWQVERLMRALG